MTETEYRKLHRLSYSWIKRFIEDRIHYYLYFELQFHEDEKESDAMVFGTLVDTLLFEEELFDEKFVVAKVSKPGGQMGELVDKLYKLTKGCRSESGEITRSLTSMIEEAYNLVAFDASGNRIAFKKKTADQVIADFAGSDAELYYKQRRDTTVKYLVELNDISRARSVIEKVRTNFNTSDVIGQVSDERITVKDQLIILFEFMGLESKGKLDRVIIDHVKKTIQPYDFKTANSVEDFEFNYRKFMYYIQGVLYYYALQSWKIQENLSEYVVLPMKFLVADSYNRYDPIIYTMSRDNMKQAMNGFRYEGKVYKGLRAAIQEIKWHRSTEIWTMSHDNAVNKGVASISVYA